MHELLRYGVLLCVWTCCISTGNSQPVQCTTDKEQQCDENYYCDTSVNRCLECLSCQELKREKLMKESKCIKSIDECGECLKGFVKDRLGDVNSPCVLSGLDEPSGIPQYVWWLIGCLVFLFIVVAVIVGYITLNPEVFKTIGNCARGTVSTSITTSPSAPEGPPPPYAPAPAHYTAVPADSPYPPHCEAGDTGDLHSGEYGPFIKNSLPSMPAGGRQTSTRQSANVFNRPIYERDETTRPASIEPEINDNFPIHDEETMESLWTPDRHSNEDINTNVSEAGERAGADASLSNMLASARGTDLVEHTPPKRLRLSLPNSNNRNSDSSGDNNQGNFSGSQNGQAHFTLNTNLIIQVNNKNV